MTMSAAPSERDTTSDRSDAISTGPIRRTPSVLQMTEVECGAASLCMILARLGRWVPLTEMRSACGISRDGATARDLVDAADDYGLTGSGHLGSADELRGLEMPAIIWIRRSHFVVLEGAHRGVFHINDPASGRYTWRQDEFLQNYSGAALTFATKDGFERTGERYRVSLDLRDRLRNSSRGVTYAVVAGVLAMLLGLVTAPLSKLFVNEVLEGGVVGAAGMLAAAMLAIGLIRGGLGLLEFAVLTRLQSKFAIVGSASFLERVLTLPMGFFMQRAVGDLSQRMTYNSVVAQLLATQIASAAIALVGILGYAIVLIIFQWVIGAIVLALALLNLLVLKVLSARRSAAQSRLTHAQNGLRGSTVSTVKGIETLKATGMEDHAFADLASQQAIYVSAQSSLVWSSALLGSVPAFLYSLSVIVILILGGYFVLVGSITIGVLLALQALNSNLNAPLLRLVGVASQLQLIASQLQSLDDVTQNPVDPRFDESTSLQSIAFDGHIELRSVTFGYSTRHQPVITDFSLDLRPGSRVALVGMSGAGKSTIGNLAAGLLAPWSGEVLLSGTPISQVDPASLYGSLTKVDQAIVLFEGTVRQNVTLWDDSIPTSTVERALADACILDEILPRAGGLDALVEENGRNFSGGQCQRLEIARALVRSPRAVILDEATSALDAETERRVDAALRARGVACLIIAHRLSTIRDADEIIVLGRHGVIIERGSHAELMQRQSTYFQLVAESGDGGDVGT